MWLAGASFLPRARVINVRSWPRSALMRLLLNSFAAWLKPFTRLTGVGTRASKAPEAVLNATPRLVVNRIHPVETHEQRPGAAD